MNESLKAMPGNEIDSAIAAAHEQFARGEIDWIEHRNRTAGVSVPQHKLDAHRAQPAMPQVNHNLLESSTRF